MKNLHLIFSFKNGGSEHLLVNLLNNWNYTEDNNYLVVINNLYDDKLLDLINEEKCKVILLGRKPGSKKLPYMRKLRKIISTNKITNIHCHSIDALYFSIISLFGFNVNFYLTVHNLQSYTQLNKLDIYLQKHYLKRIVAISNSVKETIVAKKFPLSKITVVSNGIDIKKFNKPKLKHEGYIIVCPGRIVPDIKGQDLLIDALALIKYKLHDVKCIFVGGNPIGCDYISELENRAIALGVIDIVHFAGNSFNISDFMINADLIVVPSRSEGFGLVVIESMASKTLVIGSNSGGIPEIINDNVNGFIFESNNVQDLADKILRAISLEVGSHSDIVGKAYKDVVNIWNINNTVNNYRKIYIENNN